MKKIYKKSTVHPTPPLVSDQLLSFLPAAILTLAAALSPEEKEVLAYLISCSFSTNLYNHHSKNTQKTTAASSGDHPPAFNCYCFRCYMSYWVKWDSSPNRQLIHEIIDAFEDGLQIQTKKEKSKKERRKSRRSSVYNSNELKVSQPSKDEFITESNSSAADSDIPGGAPSAEEELEKGSVGGGFLNFLGERFWGVWT